MDGSAQISASRDIEKNKSQYEAIDIVDAGTYRQSYQLSALICQFVAPVAEGIRG